MLNITAFKLVVGVQFTRILETKLIVHSESSKPIKYVVLRPLNVILLLSEVHIYVQQAIVLCRGSFISLRWELNFCGWVSNCGQSQLNGQFRTHTNNLPDLVSFFYSSAGNITS